MHYKLVFLLGVKIWLFVLIAALFASEMCGCEARMIYPLLPAALSVAVAFACAYYFRMTNKHHVINSLYIGILWLGTNLLLDSLFFMWSPVRLLGWEYVRYIGLSYIVTLLIPVAFGYAFHKKIKE